MGPTIKWAEFMFLRFHENCVVKFLDNLMLAYGLLRWAKETSIFNICRINQIYNYNKFNDYSYLFV